MVIIRLISEQEKVFLLPWLKAEKKSEVHFFMSCKNAEIKFILWIA